MLTMLTQQPGLSANLRCPKCLHDATLVGTQRTVGLAFWGAIRKYGFMVLCRNGHAMKITVEVSDDLYRRAKAEAALRGRKLKDLVEEGLRLVLDAPFDGVILPTPRRFRVLYAGH
jgi:hypothetical protein